MRAKIAAAAQRLDGLCARLNDGLVAVALALALLITGVVLQQQLPSVVSGLQMVDPATGAPLFEF
jgi:hypothetical protein